MQENYLKKEEFKKNRNKDPCQKTRANKIIKQINLNKTFKIKIISSIFKPTIRAEI